MKKILLSISALLFLALTTHSQFIPVYNWFKIPTGTTNDLNSAGTNYVSGIGGVLLKTTNSGLNWSSVNTGSTGNLRAVQSLSSNIVIVGNGGLILRSTNAGASFSAITSGTTNNLNSLARIGSSIYVAAGDGGIILYSNNAGLSWVPVSSGTTSQLNCISGSLPLIAVGNNGAITRSTDFGLSWNTVTSGTTQKLNSVDVISGTSISVGANGTIIRSTDGGGVTWQPLVSGVSLELNSIDILTSANIFSAGNGIVLKSTDNGTTWSVFSDSWLPTLNWKSIYAYNANEVYVTGPGGNIYRKTFDSLYLPGFTFEPNNMKTRIYNSGIFNQNRGLSNSAGCEWPINSGKTAIFTTGLTSAAYVNGSLRMASASYSGELLPGYCVNGNFQSDSRFKLYKVDIDRPNDSDWNNWGDMVPFGAPFVDINNNGTYEPFVDKPGVKNAKQTLFVCMTDANPTSHTLGEGFGGGTAPLGAEYHMTVWGYNSASYQDMMFFKWVVINKSVNAWDSTIFSVVSDPDLGFSNDDYIGCDTSRSLAYCYNADNDDPIYGINPPATGTMFLNCSGSNAVLTSSVYFSNVSSPGASCEHDPNGEPLQAYYLMQGIKKDRTPWVIPNTNPPRITKFCYTGDPETNTGWTEYGGRIENCGGLLTGNHVIPCPPGDRRNLMNYRPSVAKINPGDSQVIMTAQLVARGTNHKNSVTVLKQLSDVAKNLCQNGFVIGINPISNEVPNTFNLYQNYPNPFNPVTKIKFALPKSGNVIVKIYDVIGREVTTLVNEKLNAGIYSVDWNGANSPSGVYFYKLQSGEYTDTRKMVLVK